MKELHEKKIKGVIEVITTKTIRSAVGESPMFTVTVNGLKYSGFGSPNYKKGDEIEFQYEENVVEKEGKQITYRNIKGLGAKIADAPTSKLEKDNVDEVVKYLAMPKIKVRVEKTVQEVEYEPKKISVGIEMPIDVVSGERIGEVIDLASAEIVKRLKKE